MRQMILMLFMPLQIFAQSAISLWHINVINANKCFSKRGVFPPAKLFQKNRL